MAEENQSLQVKGNQILKMLLASQLEVDSLPRAAAVPLKL